MQIGLLGKANVGKSTFFSAATESAVPSGNFPFTTIEPNVGVAHVQTRCACTHFDTVSHCGNDACLGGTRLVPVRLIDVAGLVPGAHEGKGLGNQFLDDARQASIIIHVVDAAGATDICGQPVAAGTHDPVEDVVFVRDEFDFWFADILRRDWDKIVREVGQKRTKLADGVAQRFSGLGVGTDDVLRVLTRTRLEGRGPSEWSDDDKMLFARELRADSKPMIIAANKADLCAENDADVVAGRLADAAGRQTRAIPCSAETELLLRKASKAGVITYATGSGAFKASAQQGAAPSPKQAAALETASAVLARLGGTTGVQRMLDAAVFDILGYVVVYPVEDETRLTNKDGDVLPDAKLMPGGSTVRDLAASVHADLAKGLLHAIDCKTRQRISGDKRLEDGDVVKIVSTMSRG